MRDRQRWMCRLCWVFVGFHLLAILQCSYTHRKVPQRNSRQAVDARGTVDGVPGVWSSWGPWSACSSSCGIGIAQQSRRCLAQEPEGQRWALQPRVPPSQARPPHGESPWTPYSGQTVSALQPTYPLHVDSDAETVPRGPSTPHHAQQEATSRQGGGSPSQHTLPLYDDGRPYGHGRPADGERASGQGYGQPANRESVPLYRQSQLSNHDRQRLPASYGSQRLIVRESRPLYAPEGSSTQGSGSPPRPRTAANWRPSTGSRRSPMMRQDLRSSNRSRTSGVIRPGQYGYGKVPPNFRLHETMAHLQEETPRDHQGHRSSSRQPRLAEAAPLSERKGRAQREALEQDGTQRRWETEDRAAEEASVRPQHLRNTGADTGQPQAPANQLSFTKPPNLARGVKLAGSSQSEGLVPEEAGGDVHRQVGPKALGTYNALHQRPQERALQDLNFTSLGLSGPLFVYETPDITESLAGVALETSDSASFRDRPPRQVKVGSNPQTQPRRLSPGQGPGSEMRRSERAEARGRKGGQRAPSNRGEMASRASTNNRRGSRPEPSAGESLRPSKSPHRKDQREDPTPPLDSLSRSRGRRQGYGAVIDSTADIQEQDWNPHQWPSAACPGVERQYKTCTSSACPSADSDPRRAQCAGFSHLQFMGRYYEWEPFTEVRKDQRCELNCRPAGYRFYVRHADRVRDGTPCEGNSSDVCVGGRCLTPGCDGTLGSAARPDKCGVCGGDGSSCELVFGTFEDSQVNVGYHKIIEIPSGATKINVTELARSRNYLALRSRSGRSIINGNWAIDRPGKYEAAGTMFMYKRPTETSGESFYAEGPTTEGIDVYMIFQQENPGIHYEFVLPVEKPARPPQNSHLPTQSHTLRTAGDPRAVSALGSGPVVTHQGSLVPPRARGGQRDRRLQVYHTEVQEAPVRQQPVNRWTSLSATECSASCGKGFQYPIFRCVAQDTQAVVPDSHCDSGTKPASVGEACNTQPCPAFWSVGAWSECSKTCGPGIHHRQVLCRQAYANRTVAIHPQRCGHLEKPSVTQPCQARPCTHWQIQTDWESCSVPCGVGQRKRSIRCVSNQGDVVGEGECSGNPKPSDSETCDMGPCVKAWFYTDWSKQCSVECGVGVQKRSVLCLNSHSNGRSPESCQGTRPPDTRACARGRCQRQVRWYASPWNQCPVQCGNGTQNRDLICVIKLGSDFTVTVPSDCAHLDKPPSVQLCSAGPCGARWFITAWSECSKSCMGGVQAREVRCLDDAGFPSSLCDATAKLEDQRICHAHPCIPELDENCKDKHHNCPVVVQARLCTYSYYKMVCCASCTHAERRATDLRRHDAAGRRGAA